MLKFDQPKPLPNETSEDMAIRLAGDLELAPLEKESLAEQKTEMALEPLPDPAVEVARAEQMRQDEEARTAELAQADALAAQIQGGKTSRHQEISKSGSAYIESVKAGVESEEASVFVQIGSKIKEAKSLFRDMAQEIDRVNLSDLQKNSVKTVLTSLGYDFDRMLRLVSSTDVAERMFMTEDEELLLLGMLSREERAAELLPKSYEGNESVRKVAGKVKEYVVQLRELSYKLGADVQRAGDFL